MLVMFPFCFVLLLLINSYVSSQRTFRGPCTVILNKMRFSGYVVRDCTYVDPYVYWRIEHRMTWEGARQACRQISGGDLVSIHDFDERQVINSMALNNYVNFHPQYDHWHGVDQGIWIGLHDPHKKGNWVWSDGTEFDYKDWLSGQPDQHANKEHCVQAIQYVRESPGALAVGWNDIGCRWGMKAICKVPRIAVFP